MQSPIRYVWKALMFVLGVGLRAPAVIFAIWGGAYLARCVSTLSAPGVPIEYRYISDAGTMLVTAEAYQFDIETMQGFVQKIHLYAPDGREVASADAIEVALNGDVTIIRLNDPLVRAKRQGDGSLDILSMLPISEDAEAPSGALRFITDRAIIEYSDVAVDKPPLRVAIHNAGIDGAQGTYMFRADLSALGLQTNAGGSYTEDGSLIADATIENSELAPLLDYAAPFLDEELLGEFASLRADSIVLDGKFSAWQVPDNGFTLTGRGRIEGRGITTKETLRNAMLTAEVTSDRSGLQIAGTVSQKGIVASFDGRIHTRDAFRVTGRLTANAENESSLPRLLASLIGPDVSFTRASFDGNMDTDGERFLFDGDVKTAQVSYAGETTTEIAGHVRIDQDRLVARIDEGVWSGVDYAGVASVEFATGALSGGVESRRGRIEPIAERFGTDRFKGIVTANAVLSGTVALPTVDVYARGSGGVQIAEGPLTSIGVFEMRGRVDAEGVHLDRLTSNGPNGVLTAHGSMAWEDGALSFIVNGGGFDLSSASDSIKGLGFVKATVAGTREHPLVDGRLEVYGFEALERKVPQIVADWSADDESLTFERVTARAGTGQINGTGSLLWSDNSIEASFYGSGIRLEEWAIPQTVGSIDVVDGTLSGTLDAPVYSATLTGQSLFAGGVEIDSVNVPLTGDKDAVRCSLFTATSGGGQWIGSGEFNFLSKAGTVESELREVSLTQVPISDYSVTLDGLASGPLNITFSDLGFVTADWDVTVGLLKVNGTPVGQGFVYGDLAESVLSIGVEVGSIDRYIELTGGTYNLDTKEIGGDVLVYNILVEDVTTATGKPMAEWPKDLTDLLQSTTGLMNAKVKIGGTVDNLAVDVESLVLTGLEVRGRDAGELSMTARRSDGVWTILEQSAKNWIHGDTFFAVTGSVSESGELDINGELDNFQAAWLHTLFPSVPLMSGLASKLSFSLKGPYDNPSGIVTLDTEQLGYYDGDRAVNLPLSLVLGPIEIVDGVADLFGTVTYQGLIGNVSGTLPFSSLYDDPTGREPMDIKITFDTRRFADFAPYVTAIDPALSKGTVDGQATIKGMVDDLKINAELHARGETLALTVGSTYKGVEIVAKWNDGVADVSGKFAGEKTGTGSFDINAVFPDLFSGSVGLEQIKRETTLDGKIMLDGLRLQVVLPNAEGWSAATFATNDLTIGGTVSSPTIKGDIAVSEVFVRLPEEFSGEESALIYPIDPSFENITLTVAPGARITSSRARIDFFGSGRIGGSLQNPDVTLPLTVTGGRFDMPTARVTLEEGGTIGVGYRSTLGSAPTARVDLNLEGRTMVSARRADNEYEAYQVQLFIQGNLLEESGLRITASSDPPDLSSEQIMAILGQKELIENLAGTGSSIDLRETLYTVGLPTASNAISAGLARELQLDYISVDYNPFDQTVIGAGKLVGKGLMLQVNRQLSQTPGARLKYEVQLTYRLPMEDAFFSRVRLSLGLNQEVPWRLKLNWAKRF